MILSCKNVYKSYDNLQVLQGVDLQIKHGEIIAIVGSSGAGKSTLLNILGTLDSADSGEVLIDDVAIHELSPKEVAKFRNEKIGFIFQFHHLLPEFTALENVSIPGYIKQKQKRIVEEKAEELLTLLGLQDRLHHKPATMSGGEQQRVAVARALINNPAIVLADEPSGNLDRTNSQNLFDLMLDLRKELNQTFLIVTHDENLAQQADRVLHMIDGMIQEK